MDAAGKIGSAALSAMTSMGSRLGKVLNITNMSLSGFTGGVKDLGGVLWDYAWSSNFEQGTTKLANAFEAVGTNVDQAAAPLDRIKNVFKSVGEAVFGTFKAGFNVISTFFKTLLGYVDKLMSPLTTLATTLSTVFANIFNPTTFIRMAESISSITSAIAEMPVTKAMSFTASMVAFSEAGTAFTAAAEAAPPIATPAMGATAVENTTATVIKTPQIIVQTEGGGTVPDNGPTTVSISLDGLDLRKFLEGTVVQKIGELSRQALIS
jgi:phage-related protein